MSNNNMKNVIMLLLFALGAVFGVAGKEIYDYNINLRNNITDEDIQRDLLIDLLRDQAFYYTDDEQLKVGGLRGIIASLEDPYSVYFDLEEYGSFMSHLEATYAGIGVTMSTVGHYSMVVDVFENSPAEQAGIQSGDILLSVDGFSTYDLTISEVSTLIKGEVGTVRKIIVAREDLTNTMEYDIAVNTVDLDTVHRDELILENDKKIGYVSIDSFGFGTDSELETIMKDLETEGLTDLIIDVRNNGGGSLTSVRNMLDYFIETDQQPFLYESDREGKLTVHKQDNRDRSIDYNVVILMNEYSASASEIFAAAMNEIEGYQLIGKSTFGKGVVQVTYNLNREETRAVKITTGKWLTPSKEWIHEVGVQPTIEVELEKTRKLMYFDPTAEMRYDQVNTDIMYLQRYLNLNGYDIREDGYFDVGTLNAIKSYQIKLEDRHDIDINTLGEIDFKTLYYLNLDLIDFINDKTHDEQYQEAIKYIKNS